MNQSKELAQQNGQFIEKLEAVASIDKRWFSIAKTDLQRQCFFGSLSFILLKLISQVKYGLIPAE